MELIPAPGSIEMQRAIADPCVQRIVDGLLHVKGKTLFRLIALFLKNYSQNTQPFFTDKLAALKVNQMGRPSIQDDEASSLFLERMISDIKMLYSQKQQEVDYQRGAIVEVLASKLVGSRCKTSECYSNHRFIDGRYASDQVDVAVYSPQHQQCEAYTCKMNPTALASSDCTNLAALAKRLEIYAYDTHIGVICFENSALIEKKIKWKTEELALMQHPKAYGLDNMLELEGNPFTT